MPAMYESALVGKRQEIKDKVFNVEAAETPFVSMLKTGPTPNQMLSSWVAEVYPSVASTGVLDGTAATTPTKVDRYLLQGCAQHFRREWGVTMLAGLTNSAGVGRKEAAHQMTVAMLLLKRQLEQQFLSADDCTAESGSTPWTSRGVFSWLDSDEQSNYAVNSNIRPSSSNHYESAFASLTQALFRDCLESAFSEKRSQLSLFGLVGYELKAAIDDWTNVYPVASTTSQPRMQYSGGDPSVLKNFVDELRFSVGTARLQVSTFLDVDTSAGTANTYATKSGVFLDLSMWEKAYLMNPANTNLAPDGSGKKGFVDAVGILRCLNPRGQVMVKPTS